MGRQTYPFASMLLAVVASLLWQHTAGLLIGGQNLTSPWRTSCDALYTTSCSRVNAKWLAVTVADDLGRRIPMESSSIVFQDVYQGKYNYEGGFYPFLFDRATTQNVGHGLIPAFQGQTLKTIFESIGVGITQVEDLNERANLAAEAGGDWVSYVWWNGDLRTGGMQVKMAYVTNVTDQYWLGVGINNDPLPLDLPCSEQTNSWCSLNNVQSLVGRAETRLKEALSREQFEAAEYAISYDPEFRSPGGHYLFLWHFDGSLRAHPYLAQYVGKNSTEIHELMGGDLEEGQRIYQLFRDAAETGNQWIKYSSTNHAGDGVEQTYIVHIVKIEFMGENYCLGSFFIDVQGEVVPSTYQAELGLEEAHCPGYNLPCSFGNALRLSSHSLTHLMSTDQTIEEALHDITYDPRFKIGEDIYTFVADFNGTVVSHGIDNFIGKNFGEVWTEAGFEYEAGWEVHKKFRDAAMLGGGYVLYDWSANDPAVNAEQTFQKVSYVFKISRDGREYYGGVGFNHKRAPLHPNLDTGYRKNGQTIPCSSRYGSKCSELNSQAILGQALGDLVAASTETKSPAAVSVGLASKIEDVFTNITSGNELYSVNDFHVAVFSFDQDFCYGINGGGDMVDANGMVSRDESGCCVAHGSDSSYVGMTWQQILNKEGITSISGRDLHNRLAGQVDRGGNWLEYSRAVNSGVGRKKIAFASRFRDGGKDYYVMTEFFAEQPPPTCNACPGNMECVIDDQAFCEVAEPPFRETSGFVILLSVLLGVPCVGICFCYMGQKKEEQVAKARIECIDHQMQTMSKQMEHQMKSSSNAHKLVASLFPKQVHDRIMQQIEEEAEDVSTEHASSEHDPEAQIETNPTKDQWKQFMDNGGGDQGITSKKKTKKSAPICDLFPEATISFADIVGFTAWSSTREPSQVFSLLEGVYRRFDRLASKMGVFKVETVGDCYVAVCGLPEPCDDHAIVMARFATACLSSFKNCVANLELELGPGTADLSLRSGLHSGPVTAGVLRGERGRFQLFGDTVNTSARMESTGVPNRIHMSQETVTLLLDAGKPHWLKIREDKVVAKGKGLLNTYWLQVTAADLNDKNLIGVSSEGTETETTSTTSSSGPGPVKPARPVPNNFVDKRQGLVEWNVNIMKSSLARVIAKRELQGPTPTAPEILKHLENKYLGHCTSLKEVKEIVTLPKFDAKAASHEAGEVELSERVVGQLRTYIHNLAMMYNDNPFHSFHHATHVTMSVVKLLSRIVAPGQLKKENLSVAARTAGLHDYSYGITSDPLTQFAVLLSALIHDVDHPGVPNAQLVKEGASLASIYKHRSVAELNSLDLAWNLLMEDNYKDLRNAIYQTDAEFLRFRQLMVNIVLATDIMDKDLGALRKLRWNKAFASMETAKEDSGNDEGVNRKATIVLEHLIQASDIAHTMQHWHIFLKWNERLFFECYEAYKQGRSEKDPIDNWYQGEIGFFDFYIIPLAKKLKDCGVFGVSSTEYLRYAEQNRKEWEARGKDILAGYVEKISLEQNQAEASTGPSVPVED